MVKKDNILNMIFCCCFEKIFWISKEMLKELKRDKRWSLCGDKLGQMKSKWLMLRTIGSLWSVQRGGIIQ